MRSSNGCAHSATTDGRGVGNSPSPGHRRVSLELPSDLLEQLDSLRSEWGLRSRGALLARLLETLLPRPHPEDADDASPEPGDGPECFDERGALVLVAGEGATALVADFDPIRPEADSSAFQPASPARGGIDLPGFVRRQSVQLHQSLHPRRDPREPQGLLPEVSASQLQQCLQRAREHWRELYGNQPGDAVFEAAMVWLAQEIWPQSDPSDGRPFSWSLALSEVRSFAPSLGDGPASFERVLVVAGLLEDPFSAATLEVRIPTLIRRFVHRFRRERRGASFETLQHTMTLHGALKLLKLPTAPGQRLTLREIRDAYRTAALACHPDSGGSTDAMRRINEAYQLLRELYRTAG